MLRPREPHEVEPEMDGGQLFNQGPHAVDGLRLIGGGKVASVRGALVELPLPNRPSAGYFTAFLEFEDGTPATLMYNGYGYLFGWEFTAWGETAVRQTAGEDTYGFRRQLRAGTIDEFAEKEASRYGGAVEGEVDFRTRRPRSEGWVPGDDGLIIATCDYGSVRQSAGGLYVYDDEGRHEEPLPRGMTSRTNEIKELKDAMAGHPVFRDGRWGKATLEVVLAIRESAQTKRELSMQHQVAVPAL
jgi:phthalate 4,5-cis-dihydrodiol dehydrogenase